MKYLINEKLLLSNYEGAFTQDMLKEYHYVEISLPYNNVIREDIDYVNGEYVFNETKYAKRIKKENILRYKSMVRQLIAKEYDIEDELSIIRQKDNKKDEYNKYFAYCEECKRIAKETYNVK